MKLLFYILPIVLFIGCKKDCLEKDKCSPSTHESSYLIEQETPVCTGTAYYIDAQDGKKKNDGKSPDNAFKSVEQLIGIVLKPGDHVLLKRGQYHFGELTIEHSGTETNPIYVAAYGSGTMPLLKSNKNRDEHTISILNANYVSVQNLNIQGGTFALFIAGSDFTRIEGCRIGEMSHAGIRATGKYSKTDGSDFGILRYCLIYSGISGKTGDKQSTDGIQLMDGASNWHVYDNEFKAWAHSAVSIKQIYNSFENNNNIIENNLFECGDIDYMRAFDFTGSDLLVQNNVFQRNLILNQTVTSHLHGNDNTVAYNLFLDLKSTNASDQPWAIDFHVFIGNTGGHKRKDHVCYNNKIYNNLFYNWQDGSGIRILNSKSGTSQIVHNNEIVNNMFYNVGKALEIDSEPTTITITNNLFYNETSTNVAVWEGVNYSLENFELLIGENDFTILDNISDNPLLVDPLSGYFMLTSFSPAINTGKLVGFTQDYLGNEISGLPEIGALEY